MNGLINCFAGNSFNSSASTTNVSIQPLENTDDSLVATDQSTATTGDVPVNNQQSHDITSNQTQEESNDNVAATTEPTNCVEYATIIDEVIVKGQQAYPDLVFAKRMGDGSTILDVTRSNMKNIPNAGYISVARVIFYQSSTTLCYDVQVLLTSVQKGTVHNVDEAIMVCRIISCEGDHKFCPGLNESEYYDKYFSIIRFHLESVRLWDRPFKRIDSKDCTLWYQLKSNASDMQKSSDEVLCRPCKRLNSYLDHQRRRSDVSLGTCLKRQQPSSRYKLKYLSPASIHKRKAATQKERSNDKAKLSRLSEFDITLENDQSDEVSEVLQTIEQQCSEELHSILKEADAHSSTTGKSIRSSWERDKASCKAQFYSDQIQNDTGKKENRWSLIIIQIGMSSLIHCMSVY
ncbi:uncharacterized protein [Dysidea avara]|uniref:uncharacterized protein n=1 Tax=Dysidea avara TaxID=196820 RepID=UPI00332C2C7B